MLIHTLFSISCQVKAFHIIDNAMSVTYTSFVKMQGIFRGVCLRGAGKVLFSQEAA